MQSIAVATCALLLLGSCSVIDKDNRRLMNALDGGLAPESPAARWALAPITFPVAVTALVTDMAIVHPAASIDDAWLDTVDLLWTPKEETAFRRAVMVPIAAILTPIVFTGDWAGRSVFGVRARTAPEPEEPNAPEPAAKEPAAQEEKK